MKPELFELLPNKALIAVNQAKLVLDKNYGNPEYFDLYLQYKNSIKRNNVLPQHFDRLVRRDTKIELRQDNPFGSISKYKKLMMGSFAV